MVSFLGGIGCAGKDPRTGIVWMVANYYDRNYQAELRAYGAVPDQYGVLPLLYRFPTGGHAKYHGMAAYGWVADGHPRAI